MLYCRDCTNLEKKNKKNRTVDIKRKICQKFKNY